MLSTTHFKVFLLFSFGLAFFSNVEGYLELPSHSSQHLSTKESCNQLSLSLLGNEGVVQSSVRNSTVSELTSEDGMASEVCATFTGPQAGITLQVITEVPNDAPVDFDAVLQYLIYEDGVPVYNVSSLLSPTVISQFGPQLFLPSFADLSGGASVKERTYNIDIIVVSASSAVNLTVTTSMRADFALLENVNATTFSWQIGVAPQWDGQIFSGSFPPFSGSSNSTQSYLDISFTLTPSNQARLPGPMVILACLTANGAECNPTGACLGNIKPWNITETASLILESARIPLIPIGPGCSSPTGAYFILNPKLGNSYPGPYSYQAVYSVAGPFQVSNPSHSGKGGLSTGDIIGIAVGAAVAVILLVAVATWLIRRQRHHADYQSLPG